MFQHILIPIDGSKLSATALDLGMELARDAKARVTVLTVVEPFHLFTADSEQLASTRDEYEEHARGVAVRHLAEAERKASRYGVSCDTIQVSSDQPYRAIVDAAQNKGCDLIAMASHGRRGIDALLLGSVTTKVLTHSKIPVLVYR